MSSTSSFATSITDDDLLDGGDNGFLRVLKEGRFVYVAYGQATHPGPSVYLTPKDLNDQLERDTCAC